MQDLESHAPWELNNMDWSEKPGIFLGWGASDLAASVPAVADLIYEIYGARTVTKQVDEMIKFHHDDPTCNEKWCTYGLATENHGSSEPGPTYMYGHGGNTYGAQSQADYIPELGASLVVAANNELRGPEGYAAPQVGYVFCMATLAAYNALHNEDIPLRETCQSGGNGPVIGFDLYRDQNLRKASK